MSETYTLSRVSKATGVPPRTLQFWTSNGVIKPDPETLYGGPGKHRQYPWEEVAVAALLGELNAFNIQLGTLRSLADYLREVLSAGEKFGFESPEAAERAINEDRVRSAPADKREGWAKYYGLPEVPQGKPVFSREDRLRVDVWAVFHKAKEFRAQTLLMLRFEQDGKWQSEVLSQKSDPGTLDKPMDVPRNWPSYFMISVGHVLYLMNSTLTS